MGLMMTIRQSGSRLFESMSVRPLGILVFAGSVALLWTLQTSQLGTFRARAVAQASSVDHPALFDSFVSEIHAQLGSHVQRGAPLLELSPHFIERELAQLDAKIEQLLHEAALARADLLVEEERWLAEPLRRRPSRPSLQRPTEALYESEVKRLHLRRDQLLEDRGRLTVASEASGRVAMLVPVGTPVGVGTSVASVLAEYADEVVAYLPSENDVSLVQPGTPARLSGTLMEACLGPARVLRRGAAVVKAPGQLRDFLRTAVHGLPVYISIPEGCDLGVGQVLAVEFPKASG